MTEKCTAVSDVQKGCKGLKICERWKGNQRKKVRKRRKWEAQRGEIEAPKGQRKKFHPEKELMFLNMGAYASAK